MPSLPSAARRGVPLALLVLGLTLVAHAGDNPPPAPKGAIPVTLQGRDGAWTLQRGGKPYFINGGGGGGDKALLKSIGGNSWRTWGVGAETEKDLDLAHSLGMSVTVGFWLGHTAHGFSYDDPAQLEKQKADVRRNLEKLKDHPAVLAWSLGNEMEINVPNTDNLWKHVNDLARMAKEIDPNHPVMTIVADFDDKKIQSIHRLCPDVDIIGINTYGGGPSAGERYRRVGGTKPYVLTEYGPNGSWEWAQSAWKAPLEPTSTRKGEELYRNVYTKSIESEKGKLCLGGYAFTWGYKVESTPTWFGMLLPSAEGDLRLAVCDMLQEYWTGKKPANPCPRIKSFTADGPVEGGLKAGTEFKVTLDYEMPKGGKPARIEFELFKDSKDYRPYQGHGLPMPPSFPEAIVKVEDGVATVKMPDEAGPYFLYGRVFDATRGAAIAMIPLLVEGEQTAKTPSVYAPRPKAFPVVIVGDDLGNPAPYIASGYMGNNGAVNMDASSTDQPHSGATCTKVEYRANDNWAGVYWQSPANDWGEQPGGLNLGGATKLTLWARGAKGGEKVKFLFGTAGRDKPYFDTGVGEIEATLTAEWKEYSLELKNKDLRRIKHGFGWVVGGQGAPFTFYIDDVRVEGVLPAPGAKDEPEPAANASLAPKGALPFAVLTEEAAGKATFIPSGYMGNNGAIAMTETDQGAHVGAKCLQVKYNANDNWAGVYWQNPANDWNEQPGGFDLTGAKRLVLWAKGEKGGEKVKFLFGTADRQKTHHDTANGEIEATLTTEWKEYAIDLANMDLRRIKSGFGWVVGGQGAPITFYLDGVRYE